MYVCMYVRVLGTLPVENEKLQIPDRGATRRSADALMTLTLIPSIPSPLLVLSVETMS